MVYDPPSLAGGDTPQRARQLEAVSVVSGSAVEGCHY